MGRLERLIKASRTIECKEINNYFNEILMLCGVGDRIRQLIIVSDV